jgi:hypothetical protein
VLSCYLRRQKHFWEGNVSPSNIVNKIMSIMCNVDYLSFIIIVEVITIGTISKEALR